MGNFKEDIVKTEAFIFDVDGVMTDGGIMPLVDGDFIRKYYAKDGYAIAYALRMGYKVCIITGGRGATLDHRLKMLGITDVYLDCMDKISAMQDFFARHGLDPAQMALAFVRRQPFVASTLLGATTMEQLKTNIESFHLNLSEEVLAEIEAVHQVYTYPAP